MSCGRSGILWNLVEPTQQEYNTLQVMQGWARKMHLLRLARATQRAKRVGSGRFHTAASKGAMLASTPAAAAPGPTSGNTEKCSTCTRPPARPPLFGNCSSTHIGTLSSTCDGHQAALQGNGTSAMLAAVAAPQHIRRHRQAAPLDKATCNTTTGQSRCATKMACCAYALAQLFTSPTAPLHFSLAESPQCRIASGLLKQLSLRYSAVNTCHRCRCATDRPAKSGRHSAQTLISKRVESPYVGRPVGMQQAPLEGE